MDIRGEIAEWLKGEYTKRIKAMRFGLDDAEPEVGQRALIFFCEVVYFGVRTSMNYYQSGALTIPADAPGLKVASIKVFNGET